MTSVPGNVDMVVDSIIANLHSAVTASTNSNSVSTINLMQSVDTVVGSNGDEITNTKETDEHADAENDSSQETDTHHAIASRINDKTKDEELDPTMLDTPLVLIEREAGSQMVVRYDYDDIVRRMLIPSDITMNTFKELIERKVRIIC
jgi:hypothetical protein